MGLTYAFSERAREAGAVLVSTLQVRERDTGKIRKQGEALGRGGGLHAHQQVRGEGLSLNDSRRYSKE